MPKKLSIVGTVRVPTDIAERVPEPPSNVELMMTPPYEFHRGKSYYATRARLNLDGKSYFLAQDSNSDSLAIGYVDEEPDPPTQRRIKKIADNKLFWLILIPYEIKDPKLYLGSFFIT